MPRKKTVFLKQSGELLELPGSNSHWAAAKKVASNIAKAYQDLGKLDIGGLTIVPGAGNLARGDSLKKQGLAGKYADAVGRWGTIGNAMILTGVLETLGVPVQPLIINNMDYQDARFRFKLYSPQAVKDAHEMKKVVVIAGGTGKDNITTDGAVAFFASDFRQVFGGEIMVLKSTKFDGVYESDPAKSRGKLPAKYSKISAHTMKANYEQFKVVDETSLDYLIGAKLSMLIYSEADHCLSDVLSPKPDKHIGTLVVPGPVDPVLDRQS